VGREGWEPVITAPRRLRQEVLRVEVSLSYIEISCV
jgi:hypothetical protein